MADYAGIYEREAHEWKAAAIEFEDRLTAVERKMRAAGAEILVFLKAIEGDGYGGMAAFEIALQYAKEIADGSR